MNSKLEDEINQLRDRLNVLMEDEDVSTEVVLQCSQELDRLITRFYKVCEG